MCKIAVLGSSDSIFGFAALGMDIFSASTPEEGKKQLQRLTEDKYTVVYITEALAASMREEIDKYKKQLLPSIILIPGVTDNPRAE